MDNKCRHQAHVYVTCVSKHQSRHDILRFAEPKKYYRRNAPTTPKASGLMRRAPILYRTASTPIMFYPFHHGPRLPWTS